MKNKRKLLLTLSLPLLIVNCAVKPSPSAPSEVHTPPPKRSQTQRVPRPTLGTPISLPQRTTTTNNSVTQPQVANRPTPVIRQTSKYGESDFAKKFKLPNIIHESSGLIKVDNRLWTLNDSGGKAALYQIDERNGHIIKTLTIQNARNKDWEDIAYDDTYVYIGDMGNNRGNRRDLKIYKIPRASLRTMNHVNAEVIQFSYNDQKDFASKPQNNNYDCEAMIAHNGKLYLFSKNWQNQKTRLYELSSNAGKQVAKYISTFNIGGMVTGASINKELNTLLLTTYGRLLNVNVWAFTNHNGRNFFSGDKKQLNFRSALQGQVEGVTFTGTHKAYLSSEAFQKYIFSFDASLYEVDFSGEFE